MDYTLDFLIDKYIVKLSSKNLSQLTILNYAGHLTRFIEYLEKNNYPTDIKQISDFHIESFIAALVFPKTKVVKGRVVEHEKAGEPYDANSKKTVTSCFRSFFKWCHKEKYINENPAQYLSTPRTTKKIPKTITSADVAKMFDEAKQSKFASRDYLLLCIMFMAGLRVSEVEKLKVNHINMDSKSVFVQGKGAKERKIYMNQETVNAYLAYLPERDTYVKEHGIVDDSLFFSQKNQQALTKRGIQHIVTSLAKKAGIFTEMGHQISPHKLRHTFATTLYNTGKVDVLTLGKILGHSNPNSTKIYTQVGDDLVKSAMQTVDLYKTS